MGIRMTFKGLMRLFFQFQSRVSNTFSMGTFVVREDFLARTSDELTVRKGDVIIDGLPSGYGWVQGECRGKVGSVFLFHFVFVCNKLKVLFLDMFLLVLLW